MPPLLEARRVEIVRDGGYFPVLRLLPSGRVLVVFRMGAGHFGLGGRLDAAWSDDGGRTWSAPVVAAKSERDDRNPAVGLAPAGELVLAYHHQGAYGADGKWKGGGPADTLLTRSGDEGQTWCDPYPLSHRPLNGRSPFRNIITTPEGEMLMNVYGSPNAGEDRYISYLIRSRDGGWSWEEPSVIADGWHETALALLPGGEMLAALRSREQPDALWLSRSEDLGRTWAAPVRLTEKGEHPGDLLVLRDGSVLLAYGRRREPYGVEVMLSTDGGGTWGHKKALANDAVSGDCGYPSSVQLSDGTIITAYYAAGAESTNYDATGAGAVAAIYQPAALLAP